MFTPQRKTVREPRVTDIGSIEAPGVGLRRLMNGGSAEPRRRYSIEERRAAAARCQARAAERAEAQRSVQASS